MEVQAGSGLLASVPPIGWGIAGLILGAIVARFLWGGRSSARADFTYRAQPLVNADTLVNEEIRRLEERLRKVEAENRNISSLLPQLPQMAQLLTSSREHREIIARFAQLVEFTLEPAEIYIFLRTRDGQHLALSHVSGDLAPKNLHPEFRVPLGAGRLGFVMRFQRGLDESDLAEAGRYPVADTPEQAAIERRVDLYMPIVHESDPLGVLALRGCARSSKDAKRLSKLAADFAAAALHNALLHRQSELAAHSDALTGLHNRRSLYTRLEAEIEKAQRSQAEFALLLIDIDCFSHYNERHGHAAGDNALRIVAAQLREMLRSDDTSARYGGEEFAVILHGAGRQGAMQAAEKIRQSIESRDFPGADQQPLGRMTVSGGLATFPFDGGTVEELLSVAEASLFEAKQQGRNRVLSGVGGSGVIEVSGRGKA